VLFTYAVTPTKGRPPTYAIEMKVTITSPP
jgi:hypothetical protein